MIELIEWLTLSLELFPCFSVASFELHALIVRPDPAPLSGHGLLCLLVGPFQSICSAAWRSEKIGLGPVLEFEGLQGGD